jgi:hypothetical protein
MCGPKFCSMNHSAKTSAFTAEQAEQVLIEIGASPATTKR